MITESSKTGRNVLLLFEGASPTLQEVQSYMQQHYDCEPCYCKVVDCTRPSEHKGLLNPGTITVRQLPTIEEMSGLVEDFTEGMTMKEYMEMLSDDM